MERLKYLDFDLLIERVDDRYRARVLQSPAGQASAEFALPFSDVEIENLMLRVGRNRRGVRRIESPEMEAAKQFGGKLFDTVFAGEVRGALRSSVDTANREGAGLRVRLRLADAPELVDLPWEFLYNASLNRFLALSNKTPLVRYIELPETPRPLKIAPPLRVLVMISAPGDYEALDVEKEWQKLKDALRDLTANNSVTLERLDTATLGALRRQLRQKEYHVLHFIGHGGFDAQTQDGLLILEDEQGRGRRTSGQYLATVLTDHDSMRLVVLNACEGARTARNDPFAGVAQSLVQQGIPAVIAMQFEITDEASITFTHEFYAAISDGYPVDAALGGARSAIFTDVNDLEWGTPVLYLRAPDGMIFAPLSEEERAGLEQARLAQERAQEQKAAEQRARERVLLLETLYLAAQVSFAENDFDAAEKSVASLLAEDPANANARELQLKIQEARANQSAAQQQAQEQRAREQQARERQEQIETHYHAAQSAFDQKNFDAAEISLAALLALDAANAPALALQNKIPAAREQENQIELFVRAARIQLEQNRLDAADKSIERLLELDPKNPEAVQLQTQLAAAREHSVNTQRAQEIEQLYADAQDAFSKNDLDGAQKALTALLALDAGNVAALELQKKIQTAREQAARTQQERERKQQIEKLFAAAQSAFLKNDFDAADKALAALFALDASNPNARNLQQQIQDARKRAEPTALTASERIFAPPGVPERATIKAPPTEELSKASSIAGRSTQYAILIGAVIVLALLLLGGAFASGILNAPKAPPTFPGPVPNSGQMPTEVNIPSGTVVSPFVPDKGSTPTLLQAGTLEQRGTDNAPMVFVPAGDFLMGSTGSDSAAERNEKPQRPVNLDAFWIDQHEVTNAQYARCVSAGSCQSPSSTASDSRDFYYGNSEFDNYPVLWVSWQDAQNYCAWASKQLPTEAQWEKAARGTDGRIYPWGNEFDAGLLNVNSEMKDTLPVGRYPEGASPYGAVDMAGNVFEWVADWFDSEYYAKSPLANPQGPDSGEVRVLRGGAWRNQGDVRTAHRTGEAADYSNFYIGFRCAQSAP